MGCCGSHSDRPGGWDEEFIGVELQTRGIDEGGMAFMSTMQLELRIACDGFGKIESKSETDKIFMYYKIEHSNSQQIFRWTENFDNDDKPKISRPFILSYEMGTEQKMKISINRFDNVKELKGTHHTSFGSAFFDLNEVIMARNCEITRRVVPINEIALDREVYLTLSVTEKKPENFSQFTLQFEIIETRLAGPIHFCCYQKVGDNLRFIKSEASYLRKMENSKVFMFEPLILRSDAFEGAWEEKILTFHFIDSTRPATKKKESGGVPDNVLASSEISIRELIQSPLTELPLEIKNKKFGKVVLKNRGVEPILTLGSILFNRINIVPIIALDYSLGNLTFDNMKCMHHFEKIRPNYYVEAFKQICEKIKPFQHRMLGYGFGAKIIPYKTSTSNCFALNGNIFDPSIDSVKTMEDCYWNTLKQVELGLPVNFSSVIATAKEIAQSELQDFHGRYKESKKLLDSSSHTLQAKSLNNYYVLYIITAGVIDDEEDTYNELLSVAGLPLSVIFVKIGNQQMWDVDDLSNLVKRINLSTSKKRQFASIVEFDRVFNDTTNFGKFFISSVPTQALQFLKLSQREISLASPESDPEINTYFNVPENISYDKNIGLIEEEKVGAKQQGVPPNPIDNTSMYFEKLKNSYKNKMKEKLSPSDIEYLIKNGIADTNLDLSIQTLKIKKPFLSA